MSLGLIQQKNKKSKWLSEWIIQILSLPSALGLSVLPGSKFSVRAHIKKNTKLKNRRALVNDSYPWTAQTINTTEKSYDQIVQVELDQKFTVEADTSAILTVEFSGLPGEVGFVKVGRNSDYCDGEVTRDVICTEESGEPIGSVKFKLMMGCINNGVITRVKTNAIVSYKDKGAYVKA